MRIKLKLLSSIIVLIILSGCAGTKPKSKGLSMDLSDSKPVANLNVGVVEFLVK